jgi:hypothetical protein
MIKLHLRPRQQMLLLVFLSTMSFYSLLSQSTITTLYYMYNEEASPLTNNEIPSSSDNKCNRILLYDTDLVGKYTGVGNRIAYYALASIVAALTDAALVLLEPPFDGQWAEFGGSPFGCPASNRDECDKLPTGLSRIIRVPERLSLGCDVPPNLTCTTTYFQNSKKKTISLSIQSYKDWSRIANRTNHHLGFPEITCRTDSSDSAVKILVIGGFQLKRYWLDKVRPNFAQRLPNTSRIQWEQWVERWSIRMGVSKPEVYDFTHNNGSNISDYLNAVLTRAEVPKFQSWVVDDISKYRERLIDVLDKPYYSIHVRRGDSLNTGHSIRHTEEYWVRQGYPPRVNKSNEISTLAMYPTTYVPFVSYWEQLEANYDCDKVDFTDHLLQKKVYVATDDVATVKSEIDYLASANGQTFWSLCNKSVEFIFNSHDEVTTHLFDQRAANAVKHDHGTSTKGCRQHLRTISALTDLQILSESDVFVGDGRSYFSKILTMLRTSFKDRQASTNHIVIAWGDEGTKPPWK